MKEMRTALSRWQKMVGPGVIALLYLCSAGIARATVKPESPACIGDLCVGMPRDVSVGGNNIDWLLNVTHVFNIILFTIMCVWMAWACLKHNRKHDAEYDHGSSKRSMTIALSLSAFIFVIVDGNLFVNTMNYLGSDDVAKGAFWNFDVPAKDPNTVKIEINAHQWSWDVRYAGPDGKFNTADDVVTWNEVFIPVGRPVYIQLASTDVIHSFYLPNFRTKQDAMPGMINRLWFQAKQTGDYDIGCAQHCGTHHYKMKAQLSVVSDADFRGWIQERSSNAKLAYDPDDDTSHWGWDWKEF